MTSISSDGPPPSADDALRRLLDGNERFQKGLRVAEPVTSVRLAQLVAKQSPFAIILSCSDSRVPAEIVFDCSLGDLFVVRVAGNVIAPSIVGSVEFAASTFGAQLVLVMGHTGCGAVGATLDVLDGGPSARSPNIQDIVNRIAPSILGAVREPGTRDARLEAAVRENVRASAAQLRGGSRILQDLARRGALRVVEAVYSIETGGVAVIG